MNKEPDNILETGQYYMNINFIVSDINLPILNGLVYCLEKYHTIDYHLPYMNIEETCIFSDIQIRIKKTTKELMNIIAVNQTHKMLNWNDFVD